MSFFSALFAPKPTAASRAKERLMITLSHERAATGFAFLEQMQAEIMAVVRRYCAVRTITVSADKNDRRDRLAIEIALEDAR